MTRQPHAPRPLANDPVIERSLRHSMWDGAFFSAMVGSAESYFSAFAVHLRASTAQIGILAALPPLLAALSQIFSAWLGRRLGKRNAIIIGGALLQAFTLIPIALLPLVLPDYAVPSLIICAVIYFVGPNLGAPHWGSLMGELVPEARRGRYFAQRTRLSSLANFSALILAGFLLEGFDELGFTYWGFVAIFISAAILRLISAWHLMQIHDPSGGLAKLEIPWHRELWQGMRETGLLRFSLFFAAMQFGVAIAAPFFALYMLRDLGFSYVGFMFNTAASVCVQFLTLNRWGRLSDLFGNRLILVTTGMIIPVLPTLWIISTDYVWLLVVQAVSGLIWAGFTLSASNFLFDLTPRDRRVTLMAAHNVLSASAIFAGAMLGGWLGARLPETLDIVGVQWVWTTPLYGLFLLSGLTRLVIVLLGLRGLREVRKVRPMTRSGLIFRVTRVHPVSALFFEVVGRFRRTEDKTSGKQSGSRQNRRRRKRPPD